MPNELAKELTQQILEKNVPVTIVPSPIWAKIVSLVLTYLPIILLIAYLIYSAKSISIKKHLKTQNDQRGPSITFKDIGGCDEAKQELQETVAHLKDPARLKRLGGKPPKGVLLVGPPGSGKTLLARAVAGEAGVPFFSLSGSEFGEKYVGVGASRVRELFAEAKKQTPSIVFIDEIDAVGHSRDKTGDNGNQEQEQALNQLLVEMDGFEGDAGIIVLAATNRPDILDEALLRPGRFDRKVTVSLPDIRDRKSILETTVQSRNAPLSTDVDLALIARSTPGFSGADLANLVNEAALHAARHERDALQSDDFDAARDRVIMGLENERVMSEEERRVIAIHESGHALIAHYLPNSDPIYKVTIVSRGDAMGMLTRLPEADRFTVSRKRLIADMAVALGGRLAEVKMGTPEDVTNGASNDLQEVTMIARRMVTKWGFLARKDKRIGYQVYVDADYLYSENQVKYIQAEVAALIEEARKLAEDILNQNANGLNLLVEELLKRETLTREDIRDLLAPSVPSLP